MNMLTVRTQWLSAGRQETRPAGASEYSLREHRDGFDHMLTVIEHEEDMSVPEK